MKKVCGKGEEIGNHIIVLRDRKRGFFVKPHVWGNRFAAGFSLTVQVGHYIMSVSFSKLYRPVAHKEFMDKQLNSVLRRAGISGTLGGVFKEMD